MKHEFRRFVGEKLLWIICSKVQSKLRKLENFNESFTLFEHIAIKTTIKAWSELFGRLTVISFNDVLKKI